MTYLGSERHKENLAKGRKKAATTFRPCEHCAGLISVSGLSNHERNCFLNPNNKKECLRCMQPIKNFRENLTCSKNCSNKLWPRTEPTSYRTICFKSHDKKCCICGEKNIVEVHHMDENTSNNTPINLIPICPTHHQYWHSRFRHLIEAQVHEYIRKWSGIQDLNLGFLPSKGSGDDQTPLMPV